jgi:uncharacterized OB-fold protein
MLMIKGSKCECGKFVIPKRMICPACGKRTTDMEFESKGTILTHTTLHAPPQGFEGPIRLALVELGEKANLMCTIKGEKDVNIGEEVLVGSEGDMYFCEPLK